MSDRFVLVVMSTGMSLSEWQRLGMLNREMGYYRELSRHIGRICFLSYSPDEQSETLIAQRFIANAKVFTITSKFEIPGRFRAFSRSFFPNVRDEWRQKCWAVRSNQMNGAWTAMAVAKSLRVPLILRTGYILSEHTHKSAVELSSLRKHLLACCHVMLEKSVAKFAKKIIVTYQAAKDHFVTSAKVDQTRVTVIGNPIDTELFKPSKIPIEGSVLCVARFVPQKNLHALIEAVKLADTDLMLVGHGPLEQELRELSDAIGARVKWAAHIPNAEIPNLLQAHKVFALVSNYEGNPKALLEAMSTGRPCLVSNISEHDFCRNLENAYVVEKDPSAIASGLRALLNDENLRDKIGTAARNFCLEHHSMKGAAQTEAGLYRGLETDFVR